jgi:hypothetical protein
VNDLISKAAENEVGHQEAMVPLIRVRVSEKSKIRFGLTLDKMNRLDHDAYCILVLKSQIHLSHLLM